MSIVALPPLVVALRKREGTVAEEGAAGRSSTARRAEEPAITDAAQGVEAVEAGP